MIQQLQQLMHQLITAVYSQKGIFHCLFLQEHVLASVRLKPVKTQGLNPQVLIFHNRLWYLFYKFVYINIHCFPVGEALISDRGYP